MRTRPKVVALAQSSSARPKVVALAQSSNELLHCELLTRQAGVDERSLLIVNLFVDLCPIYLPLS